MTYYWLGFLLADGGFTERRISLGVANKDLSHLHRFMAYVGSTNKIQSLYEGRYHRTKFTNIDVVSKLRAKFGITNRKTYEPCRIDNITDDLLFALIVGFVDGDGCISKTGKESRRLSVVGHSSWLSNFQYMQSFLYKYFSCTRTYAPALIRFVTVQLPQNKEKTHHHLTSFYVTYLPLLQSMRKRAGELGLPYMSRKFGKVPLV